MRPKWRIILADSTNGIYRRIYSGFLLGNRINSVSEVAEAWFWRLNALADDYGNFVAPTWRVLAVTASPLREVSAHDAEIRTVELVNAGLCEFYDAGGRRHIHIVDFEKFQPNGPNGKRYRRVEANPSESKRILANPSESNAPIPIPIPTPTPTPIPDGEGVGLSNQRESERGRDTPEYKAVWAALTALNVSPSLAAAFAVHQLVTPELIAAERKSLSNLTGDQVRSKAALLTSRLQALTGIGKRANS